MIDFFTIMLANLGRYLGYYTGYLILLIFYNKERIEKLDAGDDRNKKISYKIVILLGTVIWLLVLLLVLIIPYI